MYAITSASRYLEESFPSEYERSNIFFLLDFQGNKYLPRKHIFLRLQEMNEHTWTYQVILLYPIYVILYILIYEKIHRTNNCSEAYFSSWNKKNNNAPQGIWRLITTMKK